MTQYVFRLVGASFFLLSIFDLFGQCAVEPKCHCASMGYKRMNYCTPEPTVKGSTSKISPELLFPCAVPSQAMTDMLLGELDFSNGCGDNQDQVITWMRQLHADMRSYANKWIEEADNLMCSPCASPSYAMVGYYTEAARSYLQNLLHAFLPLAAGEEYAAKASSQDVVRTRSSIDHILSTPPKVCNVPLKQMGKQAKWYLDAATQLAQMSSSAEDWASNTFLGPGALATIDEQTLEEYCNRTGPYIKSNFNTAKERIGALKEKYRPKKSENSFSSRPGLGVGETGVGRFIGRMFNGFTRAAARNLGGREEVFTDAKYIRKDIEDFIGPHDQRKAQGRWQWLQYLGHLRHQNELLEGRQQAKALLTSGNGGFQDYLERFPKAYAELEEVLVQLYLTEQVRKEYNDRCDDNKRLFYSQQLDPSRQTRTHQIKEGEESLDMVTTDLDGYAERFDQLVAKTAYDVRYPGIYQSTAGKQLFTELYHKMMLHTKGSEAADRLVGHDPVGLSVTMAKGLYREMLKDAIARKQDKESGVLAAKSTATNTKFISVPDRGVHQIIRTVKNLDADGSVKTEDGEEIPVYTRWQRHLGRNFIITNLPRDPNERHDDTAPRMLFVSNEEDINNPVLRQHNGTYHSLSDFWEEYDRSAKGTVTRYYKGSPKGFWGLEQHHTWWTPNNLLANSFLSAPGHLMSSGVNKSHEAYNNWQSLQRSLSESERFAEDRFRVFASRMRSLKAIEQGQALIPLAGTSKKIASHLIGWHNSKCDNEIIAHPSLNDLPSDHPESPKRLQDTPEDQCKALLHADPGTQDWIFQGYQSYLILQSIARACSPYVVSGDKWAMMGEKEKTTLLQGLRKCKETARKEAERRFGDLLKKTDRYGVPTELLDEICHAAVNYNLAEHKALEAAAAVTNPDERYYYSRQAMMASLSHEVPVALASQAGYWGMFSLARSKMLPEAVRMVTQPLAILSGIGLTASDGYELGVNILDLESSLAKGDAAMYQTLQLTHRSIGLVVDVLGEATQTFIGIGQCMLGDNDERAGTADWNDAGVSEEISLSVVELETEGADIGEDVTPNVWTVFNDELKTAVIVIQGNGRFNRETRDMIIAQLDKAREAGYSTHIEMGPQAATANPDLPVVLVTELSERGVEEASDGSNEAGLSGAIARALYVPIDHLVDAVGQVTEAAAQATTPTTESNPVQPAQTQPSIAGAFLDADDRFIKCMHFSLKDDGGVPRRHGRKLGDESGVATSIEQDDAQDFWRLVRRTIAGHREQIARRLGDRVQAILSAEENSSPSKTNAEIERYLSQEWKKYKAEEARVLAHYRELVGELLLEFTQRHKGVGVFTSGDFFFVMADGKTGVIHAPQTPTKDVHFEVNVDEKGTIQVEVSELDAWGTLQKVMEVSFAKDEPHQVSAPMIGPIRPHVSQVYFTNLEGVREIMRLLSHRIRGAFQATTVEHVSQVPVGDKNIAVFARDPVTGERHLLENLDNYESVRVIRTTDNADVAIQNIGRYTGVTKDSDRQNSYNKTTRFGSDKNCREGAALMERLYQAYHRVRKMNNELDRTESKIQEDEVADDELDDTESKIQEDEVADAAMEDFKKRRNQPNQLTHFFLAHVWNAFTNTEATPDNTIPLFVYRLEEQFARSRKALIRDHTGQHWYIHVEEPSRAQHLAMSFLNGSENMRWGVLRKEDKRKRAVIKPVSRVLQVTAPNRLKFGSWMMENSGTRVLPPIPIQEAANPGETYTGYILLLGEEGVDYRIDVDGETGQQQLVPLKPFRNDGVSKGDWEIRTILNPTVVFQCGVPYGKAAHPIAGTGERGNPVYPLVEMRFLERADHSPFFEPIYRRDPATGNIMPNMRSMPPAVDDNLARRQLDDELWGVDEGEVDVDENHPGRRNLGRHDQDEGEERKEMGGYQKGGSALTIYPQPVGETLQIAGLSASNAQAVVMDLSGRLLFEQQLFASNDRSIQVGQLSSGMYWLRVEQPEGVQVLRFVKQ